MFIYVVEMWSDRMRGDPWCEGVCHNVHLAHIASSEEEAVEWCHKHKDYNGQPSYPDYYPWHFRIIKRKLDQDTCCEVDNVEDCVRQIDFKEEKCTDDIHDQFCDCNDEVDCPCDDDNCECDWSKNDVKENNKCLDCNQCCSAHPDNHMADAGYPDCDECSDPYDEYCMECNKPVPDCNCFDDDFCYDCGEFESECECDEENGCKEELPDHSDALEKWTKWFETTCDHSFSPSDWEVWDGAIDTVCHYLENELVEFKGRDWILQKVKTFKSK